MGAMHMWTRGLAIVVGLLIAGCVVVDTPSYARGGQAAPVTPWLDESNCRRVIEIWEQRGVYPATIEGRTDGTTDEFRAHLLPSPPQPFAFEAGYGLEGTTYEELQRVEAAKCLWLPGSYKVALVLLAFVIDAAADSIGESCADWAHELHLPSPPSTNVITCARSMWSSLKQQCSAGHP